MKFERPQPYTNLIINTWTSQNYGDVNKKSTWFDETPLLVTWKKLVVVVRRHLLSQSAGVFVGGGDARGEVAVLQKAVEDARLRHDIHGAGGQQVTLLSRVRADRRPQQSGTKHGGQVVEGHLVLRFVLVHPGEINLSRLEWLMNYWSRVDSKILDYLFILTFTMLVVWTYSIPLCCMFWHNICMCFC